MAGMIEATALSGAGGKYDAEIDSDWMAPTPFGGYLAAMALRAMCAESNLPRPASLSCQFLAVGTGGPVRIDVTSVRAGRSAEFLEARMWQEDNLLVTAQAWMLADQAESLSYAHMTAPDIPPPDGLPLYQWEAGDTNADRPLWRHVERRLPADAPPSTETGKWVCWHRLLDEFDRSDAVFAAMVMPVWMDLACWIVINQTKDKSLGFISPTLDLTVQFQPSLYDRPLGEWQLINAEAPSAGLGLVGSRSEIWSQDGVLLAHGATQCMSRHRG